MIHPRIHPRLRRLRGIGGAGASVTLVLLLLACGGDGAPGRPAVGGKAPAFRAPTFTGDTLALEDLRGRPVLLNVWATWCGPCRFETPFLESLHREHGSRGLQVVGISVDQRGSEEAVRTFLEEHGVTYRVLRDPRMRAMDTFSVLGLPATFLIDDAGVIRFMRMGPVHEDDREFMNALEEVLS